MTLADTRRTFPVISAYAAQLSTFLYFPDERFDCRERSANNNRISGRSQMPVGAVGNVRGLYVQVRSVSDALLHVFQQVDFGAFRAEMLDDCSFVGDDGIGRDVTVHQIVDTDLQDDDVRARRNRGVQSREDSCRRVAVHALVRHGDLMASKQDSAGWPTDGQPKQLSPT